MSTPPVILDTKPTTFSLASVGQILGRAFFDDPLYTRIQPSSERRRLGLGPLYTACLRHAAQAGGIVFAEAGRGALGWLPVHALALGLGSILRSGYLAVPWHFGAGATLRLSRHGAFCDGRVHAHARRLPAGSSAAYIYVVGVDPACSGRGVGGGLVRAALEQIAANHTHCLLRTEQPRNIRFYEKLGFSRIEEVVVPSSGMTSWFFERSTSDLR
jgi:GNAT superfamily N-acetyltransferase